MSLCLPAAPTHANNLTISNISLEERDTGADTAVVEFDISWENSWRDDENWDAAWVFLKVCKGGSCSPAANTAWTHGMLATSGDNPADTDPGSNTDLNIQIPNDKVGAFIYRKSRGGGAVASNNVRLTLDYAESPTSAGDTDTIQVKVFGIEMVYIPDGDFYIGDGDGTNESANAFHTGTGNTAVQITSALASDIRVDSGGDDDSQLTSTGIGVDGDGGLDTNDDGDINDDADNALFPTGWQAFYLMKYELSQGQYRDFLNTLTREQQTTRMEEIATAGDYVMTDAASVTNRHTIRLPDPLAGSPYPEEVGCDLNENGVFNEYNDGEWIAMNYLSWMDLAAYADWAGMRPMTETEFEKAARGPLDPVYREYAWGTTMATDSVLSGEYLVNAGQASEQAPRSGPGLANYDSDSSYDPDGPMRVGFAATGATGRVTAGAGYYGNLNMSDNLWEQAVTLGLTAGRAFEGSHGDGLLTTTSSYEGNATNSDWPGIDATTSRGVTGESGVGLRTSAWDITLEEMRVSSRSDASGTAGGRQGSVGGRLARTAPVEGFECGDVLVVSHHSARGVAPEDRTIRYKTVQTSLSGESACWIAQNLGATKQAASATDSTEAAGGWYWQFNRKQGYSHDGTTLNPAWTITSIDEDSDWTSANDPCTLELGDGWRLPTETEWDNAGGAEGGNWGDYNDTYASVLKLHAAGYLDYSDSSLYNRGSVGSYWSSTQSNTTFGYNLYFGSGFSYVNILDKAYGFSGRCLKD